MINKLKYFRFNFLIFFFLYKKTVFDRVKKAASVKSKADNCVANWNDLTSKKQMTRSNQLIIKRK